VLLIDNSLYLGAPPTALAALFQFHWSFSRNPHGVKLLLRKWAANEDQNWLPILGML